MEGKEEETEIRGRRERERGREGRKKGKNMIYTFQNKTLNTKH